MRPNTSEWIFRAHAADDVPEDHLDRADQGEADPLVPLPAKRRHNQSDEVQTVFSFHRKQPPALCAWQAAGVCEDDSVVLPGEVTDDTSADSADEEIWAEGAERRTTSNNRAAFEQGRAALPGDEAWIYSAAGRRVCLEYSKPAEELSISHQLLILIITMETPLVSLLEK